MGKHTVRFRCHHCLHCCTDVVALPTPYDVVRIARATGRRPHEFVEFLRPGEVTEVEADDPSWLDVDGERFIMALRRDAKRGCLFLDRAHARCTVYDARPILCRLFPFRLHESRDGVFRGFSLHQDVGCPRHQDGVMQTRPLYELYTQDCAKQDDYHDLVRVFNRRRHSGKKPEDFIGCFYEERPGT